MLDRVAQQTARQTAQQTARQTAGEPAEKTTEKTAKTAAEPLAPATVRVLLVDDDEVDREAVTRLLKPPHEVLKAPTGRAALGHLRATPPDCVLLDYLLPDSDAFQLLERCVEVYVPVVVLTGEDSPELIVSMLQRGAQDCLVKSQLNKRGLEAAIHNAVEKVALRRDLDVKQRLLALQAEALETKNRQLRQLASDLTLAEQRERHQIAHVLHDDLQQRLYGVRLLLRAVQRDVLGQNIPGQNIPGQNVPGQGSALTHLQEAYDQLGEALQASRQLTVDLSPPVLKGEGLLEALGWLASQMRERFNLQVELEKKSDVPLPSEAMRILLFQIVRELLANVAAHAAVDRVRVTLQVQDEFVYVSVADEGRGFDPGLLAATPPSAGFGLYAVREKLALFGGGFVVESSPGHGTRATLTLPVANL